jgi:mannan endo-1,4-beta-mannosidase
VLPACSIKEEKVKDHTPFRRRTLQWSIACLLTVLVFWVGEPSSLFHQSVAHAADTGFVSRCGIHFCLNGHTYYFAGANTYDVFTYGDGSSTATQDDIENKFMDKAKIDAHMAALQADKVSVLRLWMFSHEQWHGFEPSKGVYNEAEFDLFDYIVQSAIAHNIKLLPALENNWTAYGGIDQRLQWEGLSGGDSNRWMFFNQSKCPGCFTQYKNYVNHVLNHVNHYSGVAYKDEPAIFAWELMNEPRYQNATPDENTTGTTLRAWVDTMASYIKGIDSHHMVDAGLEGQQSSYGYGGDAGNPFVYIQQSPYIDFTSAHPYPTESWANLTLAQTQTLIDKWVSDSHNLVGKPFVMGEYNVQGVDRSAWWTGMQGEIEKDGGDGDLFWWYEGGPTDVDPTYGVMQGASELAVFRQHSANMQAKSGTVGTTPTPTTPTPTTPTPSPTASATPSPTPVTGSSCKVKYAVANQWPGGFTANITITNTGTSTLNNWTLVFTFPGSQQVTQGWNGTFTQQGAQVTVKNASYNGTIAAGGSVSPGFNGSWTGSNASPTSFTLNGGQCSIAA